MNKLGLTALSASSYLVGLYITHLRHKNPHKKLRCSTIRSHLSAISYHYKINGLSNPTSAFLISKLLTSFTKQDSAPFSRKAISLSLLAKLIKSLTAALNNRYDRKLYALAFSILYHAALRSSEVCLTPTSKHTLQTNIVSGKWSWGKRCLKIALHSHKHSTEPPPPVLLQARADCTCPVKLYHKYTKVRGPSEGPLLIHSSGDPIIRPSLASVLRQCLGILGKRPSSYNTHSFRIGKATDMAKAGCTDLQIKLTGRWHSQALQRYIKPSSISS